jgi:hypothetical protein
VILEKALIIANSCHLGSAKLTRALLAPPMIATLIMGSPTQETAFKGLFLLPNFSPAA